MEVVAGVGVIRVQGDLDVISAPKLKEAVDGALVDGARNLVIDCRAVDFVDSSGLRVFLHAHQRSHEHCGIVTVRCPSPFMNHLLQITGLDAVLQIDGTPEPDAPRGDPRSTGDPLPGACGPRPGAHPALHGSGAVRGRG
jgi:anti-sigma B factor antagonist